MSLSNKQADCQEQTSSAPQRFTAAEARSNGFLAVPLSAVRQLGQSAQSLAGILAVLRQDGRTTARQQNHLAAAALVPTRTFQRHLAALEAADLVKVTREPNQTAVMVANVSDAEIMGEGFLPIPRYAAALPWSERLVYSWIVYRAELSIGGDTAEDSIGRMVKVLRIARRSVVNAINGLVSRGWIERSADLPGEKGSFRLLPPTTESGSAKVASPTESGGAKVASPPMQKWRGGSAKVASPSSKNFRKNSGQRRSTDHVCYQIGEVGRIAADLFKRADYRGDDGSLFWKLAGMVAAGLVSEHEAHAATNGARECAASNRPAYTAAILKRHLASRGADLSEFLRRVRIEPELPNSAPGDRNQIDLAGMFQSVPPPHRNKPIDP